MVYQPALGVAEIRMKYLLDFEAAENVYHVEHGSLDPWPLADLEDLASTFEAWETSDASVVRTVSASLIEVVVTDLTSLTTQRVTRAVSPVITGAVGGDSLPNNATIAIKADINNRGRGKSGRVFWVGLAESQVTANHINTVAGDAIVLALNNLRADVLALDPAYHMVVVHRVVDGVRPAQADWSAIASFSLTDQTVDSQKNRLPNHKRHKRAA